MKKKLVIMVLAALVSASALSAGGNTQNRATAGGAVRITATYPHFGGIPTDTIVGKAWHSLMEQKTGQKLEIQWNYVPYGEYGEKTNLMMAANDITDLTYIFGHENAAPYEAQGIFEDLSKHWDKMPNYAAYLETVPYGKQRVFNSDGTLYFSGGGGLARIKSGIDIGGAFVIRQDTFQKHNIKPFATTDDLYQAAKQLKALYPQSYPISWWRFSLPDTFATQTGIYDNGNQYVYGPTEPNFRTMLVWLNKLYAEGLLDPETFTQNDDTRTRKALNGNTFIQLGLWDDQLVNWNNKTDATWAWIKAPSHPGIPNGWQADWGVNTNSIANSEATYIKAGAKNMDTLIRICDASFEADTIRLISWGVEGQSYTLKADGTPTFVDKFRNAPNGNFWVVGDEYGIRISSKYRPGIQGPWDGSTLPDLQPADPAVIDGQYVKVVWMTAFPDATFPTDPMFPPWVKNNYPIAFTPDESNANASILTAIQTYYDEQFVKFINGSLAINDANWNNYVNTIKGMNIQKVLDMYNTKAAAFKR
jgi:putative aldouronate transport system substrate-binding protein